MFKKLISKYYFYAMGALTAVSLVMLTIYSTAESMVEAMFKNPIPILSAFILMGLWAILLLATSVVLLFSAEKREKLFLLTTHTEVRDELEEKATSDAVKQAFFFNIVVLAFIFSISGFYKMIDTKGVTSYGYGLTSDVYEVVNVENIMTMVDQTLADKLEKAPAEKKEELAPLFKEASENTRAKFASMLDENQRPRYIIPKAVYSPYGIIWFILLQFVTFKTFLFLNLRKLNSDED